MCRLYVVVFLLTSILSNVQLARSGADPLPPRIDTDIRGGLPHMYMSWSNEARVDTLVVHESGAHLCYLWVDVRHRSFDIGMLGGYWFFATGLEPGEPESLLPVYSNVRFEPGPADRLYYLEIGLAGCPTFAGDVLAVAFPVFVDVGATTGGKPALLGPYEEELLRSPFLGLGDSEDCGWLQLRFVPGDMACVFNATVANEACTFGRLKRLFR